MAVRGLVEIEALAIGAAELVEVAARHLDPSRVGAAAHLRGIEAGSADQPLNCCFSNVVVPSVEEACPAPVRLS